MHTSTDDIIYSNNLLILFLFDSSSARKPDDKNKGENPVNTTINYAHTLTYILHNNKQKRNKSKQASKQESVRERGEREAAKWQVNAAPGCSQSSAGKASEQFNSSSSSSI